MCSPGQDAGCPGGLRHLEGSSAGAAAASWGAASLQALVIVGFPAPRGYLVHSQCWRLCSPGKHTAKVSFIAI